MATFCRIESFCSIERNLKVGVKHKPVFKIDSSPPPPNHMLIKQTNEADCAPNQIVESSKLISILKQENHDVPNVTTAAEVTQGKNLLTKTVYIKLKRLNHDDILRINKDLKNCYSKGIFLLLLFLGLRLFCFI